MHVVGVAKTSPYRQVHDKGSDIHPGPGAPGLGGGSGGGRAEAFK